MFSHVPFSGGEFFENILSVEIFPWLKVLSNRKKMAAFNRLKHITGYKISNF